MFALDARSGKLVWHQQLIHHDLWDYDLAAQPVLGDIEVQGVPVPAVIQATKTGMLYVFDRTKGQPLFPIEENPVPPSFVAGEQASPTQPFSAIPSLVSQKPVDPADALNRDGFALGALDAARFLAGRPPRLYTMDDLLATPV